MYKSLWVLTHANNQSLDYFIVENFRSARRFLRSIGFNKDFDKVQMFELNKRTSALEIETMIKPLLENHSVAPTLQRFGQPP